MIAKLKYYIWHGVHAPSFWYGFALGALPFVIVNQIIKLLVR